MTAWLVHPVPLLAVLVTAANDHVLKGSGLLPGWLTGKLSDFAGLFFFPLAAAAVLRARRPVARTAVVLASAALFALFKLSPAACSRIAPLVGVTPDPTDLVALPMVGLAWWWMARWRGSPRWTGPAWTRTVAVGAAALTSAATSPPMAPYVYRPLPMWRAVGDTRQSLSCADVDLWVSKSGRQGVGLTIALAPRGSPCALRLDRVALVIPGAGEHLAAGPPASIALDGEPVLRYLALAFDNAAAWADGPRAGFVRVDVTAPEGPRMLRFDVAYVQAPPPRWGTDRGILITGTAPDHIELVLRLGAGMTGPVRIETAELLADGGPIATCPLGIEVAASPDEQSEVPISLPVDRQWVERLGVPVRLRVSVAADGHAPRWITSRIYVLSGERAP